MRNTKLTEAERGDIKRRKLAERIAAFDAILAKYEVKPIDPDQFCRDLMDFASSTRKRKSTA